MKKAIVASLIVASLLVVMTISVNAQEKNTEAWIPGRRSTVGSHTDLASAHV